MRTTPTSPPPSGVLARSARDTKHAGASPQPQTAARARPVPVAPPAAKTAVQVATAPAPARVRFFDDLPAKHGATPVVAVPAAPSAAVVASIATAAPAPSMQETPVLATPTPAAVPQAASRPTAKASPSPAPAQAQSRNLFDLVLSFAQRSDQGKAPIEDRSSSSPAARPSTPASVPPRIVPRVPADAAAPAGALADETARVSPAAPPEVASSVAPALTLPAVRTPAPRPLPPSANAERQLESGNATPDLAAQAQRALASAVPYSAARAQPEVARVLWVASNAHAPGQERSIVEAVQRTWSYQQVATAAVDIAPAVATQLSEEARQAYVNERNVRRAVDLQLRAFGANPRDPEVAGNLAFLYLKASPAQPEVSRQLVLHAMALASLSRRSMRVDDWNTLAVASALTGREADAINAFYVVLALTRDLDRSCKDALSAVDAHGGSLIVPVQTMMVRIRQHGRSMESAYCSWPVHWKSARG